MKRVSIFLFLIYIFLLPCYGTETDKVTVPAIESNTTESNVEEKKSSIFENAEKTKKENGITIFRFQLPDEEEQKEISEEKTNEDIISDDITADTSKKYDDDYYYEITNEKYLLSDMYTDVLKGYAVYNEEEEEEGIDLEIPDSHFIVFNIKNPVSVGTQNYSFLKTDSLFKQNEYSKLNSPEYSIAPIYTKNSEQKGAFTTGTIFSQFIDTGELEQSSSIFSRYQYKRFAITTTYQRTLNSTNSDYSDNFYLAPELKLNNYFTIIQKLSANPVTKRKKAEFVLSINPLGNKDSDRIRFDLGASQSYDDENNVLKNQFRFYTIFKL